MDAFARRLSGGGGAAVRVDRLDCRALTARVRLGDVPLLLAKPQTYMNLSGESVKGLLVKYGVPAERLLVVLDDTALPVGRLRLRASGSSGGQKGLQSIIDCLGSNAVPRLRLGIAGEHLRPGDEKADYVLSRFSKAERPLVTEVISVACDAVEAFLTRGLESAMNRYNSPPGEVPAG